MPLSAASGSIGDFISHYTGVRLRVTGGGTLRLTFFGQDELTSYILAPITLASTTRFHPFVLANVIEQRTHLQLQTTEINDDFTIARIIIFGKTVATQIPR